MRIEKLTPEPSLTSLYWIAATHLGCRGMNAQLLSKIQRYVYPTSHTPRQRLVSDITPMESP